jgi:hypothetical protein
MAEHKFSGEECLVAHIDEKGALLPGCRKCFYCGWVPYPYTQPCEGLNIESAATIAQQPQAKTAEVDSGK